MLIGHGGGQYREDLVLHLLMVGRLRFHIEQNDGVGLGSEVHTGVDRKMHLGLRVGSSMRELGWRAIGSRR